MAAFIRSELGKTEDKEEKTGNILNAWTKLIARTVHKIWKARSQELEEWTNLMIEMLN